MLFLFQGDVYKTPRPEKIEQFAEAACQKLRDPDSTFRKSYVALFVARIDVMDHEIRISGSNAAIAAEACLAPLLCTTL